jgi:pimeloyl-ACP methyl ester carboxylesterase
MTSTSHAITSRDGTVLQYFTEGRGPALILIPGALAEAADLNTLAQELTARFTVHTLERRGHGDSGPQGTDYSIEREAEDVLAIQEETNAAYLFGHSFGGLVALEAARTNSSLRGVAVYEPGVSVDGSVRTDWAPRCESELNAGRGFAAFITFARGINPETTGRLPRWLLAAILHVAMRRSERAQKARLMRSALREHLEVARLDNTHPRYREISAPVLLMVGGRGATAADASTVASALAGVIPGAEVVSFPRHDHFGPETRPAEVARRLAAFFANLAAGEESTDATTRFTRTPAVRPTWPR